MPPRKRIRLLSTVAVLVSITAAIRGSSTDDRPQVLARSAYEILSQRCFACHGANGIGHKNVFVLDRERLVESQTVVPGDPGSLLIKMVESNAMPMNGPALREDEKSILRNWVIAGAPVWSLSASPKREFIDEQKLLTLIEKDLRDQPQRGRQFLRYFSLAHLYNAVVPEQELDIYRAGLSKLINSLSWHKEITMPAPVDQELTLYRIDLRDCNWTAATWELLLSANRYA